MVVSPLIRAAGKGKRLRPVLGRFPDPSKARTRSGRPVEGRWQPSPGKHDVQALIPAVRTLHHQKVGTPA
jgi:hypothetical protein